MVEEVRPPSKPAVQEKPKKKGIFDDEDDSNFGVKPVAKPKAQTPQHQPTKAAEPSPTKKKNLFNDDEDLSFIPKKTAQKV